MSLNLDNQYWDNRYETLQTGWDIGHASTPLKNYIDQLTDKNIAILIPGCGNAYEAVYLLEQGFTDITLVDISPVAVAALQQRLIKYEQKPRIICGDFFDLRKKFDLVLEQTFFCALDPSLRKNYTAKMHEILNDGGKLVGVLFDRDFEAGPPFSGHKEEYEQLFAGKFLVKTMEKCYNSIEKRNGNELFINLVKI